MSKFIQRFNDKITGVLSGMDRLVIRGYIRRLSYPLGMKHFLYQNNIPFSQFGKYALNVTNRLKVASCKAANESNRPIIYLHSSKTDKEALARKIAAEDGIDNGLIAVLSCVEPCKSYDVERNHQAKKIFLVQRIRKCLYLYHYFIHPEFGFMHARIQTWFPFPIQICLNGREWLTRMMDAAGLKYRREDNCIFRVEDFQKAQKLADRQSQIRWFNRLNRIVRTLNPIHKEIFKHCSLPYYFSVHQSELATDIVFKHSQFLADLSPRLMLHAITHLSCADATRFLSRRHHRNYQGEVGADFKDRHEGIRVKHRRGQNSVKGYRKHPNVFRVECTINRGRDMKVYRANERDPLGPKSWRHLRQTIADLHFRTELSQAANERYLDALAEVDNSTPLGELLQKMAKPTTWKNYHVRGLRPETIEDLNLFRAVMHGEFTLNGFRNRDLQNLLFKTLPVSDQEKRRRSSKVSRQIRLLRAHHIIRKIPNTYRYMLTPFGTQILKSVLTVHNATLDQLQKLAA